MDASGIIKAARRSQYLTDLRDHVLSLRSGIITGMYCLERKDSTEIGNDLEEISRAIEKLADKLWKRRCEADEELLRVRVEIEKE